MAKSDRIGPGGGRIPVGSIRSGEKGSATGGTGQTSTKYLFGGDLYCMKDPFGADFYTRRLPFGGSYYCETYGFMIYG